MKKATIEPLPVSKDKYFAIGRLIIYSIPLEKLRGGKQQFQKIIGASRYKIIGKKGYTYTYKLHELSIQELDKMTEKIRSILKQRGENYTINAN